MKMETAWRFIAELPNFLYLNRPMSIATLPRRKSKQIIDSTLLTDRHQIGLPTDFIGGFVLAIYVAVICHPAFVKPNGNHFEPQRISVRAGSAKVAWHFRPSC